ncbi:MAG: WD40 repeat domain-containing protein [Planctomycetes bacterium]|nr:WD40 repeat domain-containing protein [Planctomycetota bacterium]
MWDLTARARRATLQVEQPSALALSPDGRRLVTVARREGSRSLDLWDAASGAHVRGLAPVSDTPLAGVAFADAETLLLARHSEVAVLRLDGGAVTVPGTPHDGAVLQVTTDGERVVSGDVRGDVAVWRLPDRGLERRHTMRRGYESGRAIAGLALVEGERVAALDQDGRLCAWDAGPDAPAWTIEADAGPPLRPLAGGLVVQRDGALRLVDREGRERRAAPLPPGLRPEAVSDDLSVVLGTEYDGATRSAHVRLRVGDEDRWRQDEGEGWRVGLALSRDGALAAVGFREHHVVHLVRARDGASVGQVRLPDEELRALALSPDGGLLVTGDDEGLRLWDTGGAPRQVDRVPMSAVHDRPSSLAFTPDGRALLVGTERGVVLWFEVVRGE